MERILAYFGSYKFIFSVCIVAAALVCWLLLRHLIHRFTEKITAASALSGRRQTYLALALNSVRGLLALLALILGPAGPRGECLLPGSRPGYHRCHCGPCAAGHAEGRYHGHQYPHRGVFCRGGCD